MGNGAEQGATGEVIDPQATYKRLEAAYQLLPVVEEATNKYESEKRRREFPDGAILEIGHNTHNSTLAVRVCPSQIAEVI